MARRRFAEGNSRIDAGTLPDGGVMRTPRAPWVPEGEPGSRWRIGSNATTAFLWARCGTASGEEKKSCATMT